jgi:archaellum component FlaC
MPSYRVITLASIVVAILGLASASYFNAEYNRVFREYGRLRSDYASLSDGYRKLEESLNYLRSKYSQLNSSYIELNSNYTSLLSEYDVLKMRYKDLDERYSDLQSRYNALMNDYMMLRYMYERIDNSYKILESRYSSLAENHSILQKSFEEVNMRYRDIQSEYAQLKSLYIELQESSEALEARYLNLSRNYESWRRYMLSYLSLPDSISRVLSDYEINRLIPVIQALITYPSDYWFSIKEIYTYIRSRVGYADDPPTPYPPAASILEAGCFKLETYRKIILSPVETLERGYGDSEDQSILLYALIKSYERCTYGREYVTWLLDIALRDGCRHMAVAIPAQGGRIAVIDPAEGYYTGYPSSLRPSDPYTELISYSSRFITHEGIENIAVYMVRSGRLIKLLEGSLYDIIEFMKQLA